MYSLTAYSFNVKCFQYLFLFSFYVKVHPMFKLKGKVYIPVFDQKVWDTIKMGGTSLCDIFKGAPFEISLLVISSVMLIYSMCSHRVQTVQLKPLIAWLEKIVEYLYR